MRRRAQPLDGTGGGGAGVARGIDGVRLRTSGRRARPRSSRPRGVSTTWLEGGDGGRAVGRHHDGALREPSVATTARAPLDRSCWQARPTSPHGTCGSEPRAGACDSSISFSTATSDHLHQAVGVPHERRRSGWCGRRRPARAQDRLGPPRSASRTGATQTSSRAAPGGPFPW